MAEPDTTDHHGTHRMALLVAVACVLQIAESLLPHPIPGLRLGLANTLTLVALVMFGFRSALELTVLRTILSSFIIGTFMSPGFILSFSAGIVSTFVMGLVYWLATRHRRLGLSIIGVSVVGALAHNTVQLLLAYALLVRHPGIFIFFPWLMIGAVVMGWVTGLVAGGVCRRIAAPHEHTERRMAVGSKPAPMVPRDYVPGDSLVHRVPSVVKIASVVVLAIVILVFTDPWLYLAIFVLLLVAGAVSGASPVFFAKRVGRYAFLLAVAFLLPAFFNSGTHVLASAGPLRITTEGIRAGCFFAARILLLMMASSLWVRTTSPQEMTRGLTKLLSPLRAFGIPVERSAAIVSEAWLAIPAFWGTVTDTFHIENLKKLRGIRDFVPLLTELIAALYVEAEDAGIDGSAQGGSETATGRNGDRLAADGGGGTS